MFVDAIRALFRSESSEQPIPAPTRSDGSPVDPLHLAACALLVEVAWADGEFSVIELEHLEGALERHFGLPAGAGRELIGLAEAERRHSIDHFQFTTVLRRNYDLAQKMVLAEVMWGLVLADGRIFEHEHYLTRKITNLLELEPAHLSEAKALAATAAAGGPAAPDSGPGR